MKSIFKMLSDNDKARYDAADEQDWYDSDTSQIINATVQISIFGFGLFLHIKIIHESFIEKNKTWMMQITHSVAKTIYLGFLFPFQALTHFVPNLSSYTGNWICYVGSFIIFYGYQDLIAHSLWIAIEKYILIVHTFKAKAFGEARIEKIFLWINIMFPFFSSVIAIASENYGTRGELKTCFGILEENFQFSNSSSSKRSKFLYCDVSSFSEDSSIILKLVQISCVFRAFVNLTVGLNIPEAFFYYKIFKYMKR